MLVPKYGEPPYLSNDAYEMKSRSGKRTNEVILTEENETQYKGATANDRQDMDRLGKTQELRVGRNATTYRSLGMTKRPSEKLRLPFNLRVFAAAGQRMGTCDNQPALSTLEWWIGRWDLDVSNRHCRHDF
jgi:hypothetical protein